MKEVVAALDTLCDAKEAARDRVVRLVEHMAVRLEHKEGQCEQLQEENNQLRRVQCEQQQRIAQQAEQIADLEHRLHQMCSPVKV